MRVGVTVPLAYGDTEDGRAPAFAETLDFAARAEAVGLDSIWVYDHLIFRFPPEPDEGVHEAWTTLTALAPLVPRVELGALVMCSSFRNAGLMAKMAATLDDLSGGRLILGLGCGWHEPEFDAFGYPFDHRVSRFEEGMRIVAPLVREGRVTFEGRYHRAIDAELRPPTVREGGPPILIAGKQPRMLKLVAEHADQWNAAWFGHPDQADELRTRLVNLRSALDEAGRDPASLAITVGIFVAFDDDGDIPDRAIGGSVTDVGAALAGYADLGVSHLIVHLWPRSPDGVRRLAEAAAIARDRVPTPA
jgi:alkanesulfonate monooxygenase SsuD/methylene tetrahydromethanopterin reductase-like flavin-dependent oxidoreductase (luciferase family)